jgi:hypothetical protein
MMGAALRRALIARKEMHKPLITKNIPKDNGFDRPPKSAEQNSRLMYK